MARFSFALLLCLTLHSAWSYYGPHQQHPQPLQSRVVYRHHYVPYQPQVPFMSPVPPRPSPFAPPVPYASHQSPIHMRAARPVPYYAAPPHPMHPPPHPLSMHPSPHSHPMHPPYAPAATHQQSFYSQAHPMIPPPPPPSNPRQPYGSSFGAFNHQAPKSSFFNKIKPYIFGGATGPRSLPHDPFYPNYFHPHHFTPNRPFHNRPSAHHAYPVHAPPPSAHHHHHSDMVMKPQKSCSCSLHVGHLTVYKHTDMRSSYSCHDLKDCTSFCTNLFSNEDLRAQTRADACLIIGKDTKVPWFRRDHVCEPNGVKNDTKLSVDLCCKDLQPC